jgi:hypothetical protein
VALAPGMHAGIAATFGLSGEYQVAPPLSRAHTHRPTDPPTAAHSGALNTSCQGPPLLTGGHSQLPVAADQLQGARYLALLALLLGLAGGRLLRQQTGTYRQSLEVRPSVRKGSKPGRCVVGCGYVSLLTNLDAWHSEPFMEAAECCARARSGSGSATRRCCRRPGTSAAAGCCWRRWRAAAGAC